MELRQKENTMLEDEKGFDFDLELVDGNQLALSSNYEHEVGSIKVTVKVDAVKLIDKITDIIPGEWDDKLIDGLAAKLLSKKTGDGTSEVE